MSLQEIKVLLQQYQITPNKLLGQNFMVDPSVFPRLGAYAELGSGDVVLDAGAGFGYLTRFLADKCRRVVAVEKDPAVADVLTQQTRGIYNITIIEGDILKTEVRPVNRAISSPHTTSRRIWFCGYWTAALTALC
jgi:16S rRNA (adenine1518-N6/adenine1519-N6)-dimethyltransferase